MAEHNGIRVTQSRTTQTTIFTCNYTWTINNFPPAALENMRILKSSFFVIDGLSYFFQMEKKVINNRTYCEFTFNPRIYEQSRFHAGSFAIRFIELNNGQQSKHHTGIKPCTAGFGISLLSMTMASVLSKISGNSLTMQWEFQLIRMNSDRNNPQGSLQENMKHLLLMGAYGDVTLKTPTKEFKAHKLILSSRSPVFAAMFQNDVRDANQNTVEINDISDNVLEELLKFIYTDETLRLDVMATALLMSADKYDVQALKSRCEKSLFETATVENAGDLLLLADSANAAQLRTDIKRFIVRNRGDFVRTDKYRELRTSRPELILEIFEEPVDE